jgi:uncharacterized membrane protein YfcA
MEDTIQTVRLLNLVLGVTCLLWMGARTWLRRKEYPFAVLLFLQALAFYVFSATYGSFEALYLDADALFRPFIVLVCHAALLTCLALTQKRRPIVFGGR